MKEGTDIVGIHRVQAPIVTQPLPYYTFPIPAGFPSPASDYLEESIDLNEVLIKTPSATFFVRVEGESMVEAFIPPKALLIVDRSINAVSGHIIVAVIDGEFTVKRLLETPAGMFLCPANARYKPIKITEEMSFRVWGVVTKIISDPQEV